MSLPKETGPKGEEVCVKPSHQPHVSLRRKVGKMGGGSEGLKATPLVGGWETRSLVSRSSWDSFQWPPDFFPGQPLSPLLAR